MCYLQPHVEFVTSKGFSHNATLSIKEKTTLDSTRVQTRTCILLHKDSNESVKVKQFTDINNKSAYTALVLLI